MPSWRELTKGFQENCIRVLKRCELVREFEINGKKVRLKLHVPSGDMKYPSFWVRDAAMMSESGLISPEELHGWLQLIMAAGQNGPEELLLENGLKVPPWSIADHINFDGKPVYFPGTYSSGTNQGDGGFGFFPPHDDQYSFINMAYNLYLLQGDTGFLDEEINGVPVADRLENAFDSYNINWRTQLCESSFDRYTVDWGFCDSVKKSGLLLYPSLLRYRAALELSRLWRIAGKGGREAMLMKTAGKIRSSILEEFAGEGGWLLSSTGACRQHDIWGTAFAVWLGVLDGERLDNALKAMKEGYMNGSAVHRGYVRHIPEGEDASENSAWEYSSFPYNTYQNGGYWATPSGWYIYALSIHERKLALEMAKDLLEYDREYENRGAPYEWRTTDNSVLDGKMYGTSAALPYAALKRMAEN